MYTDVICYESEMRYLTDSKLLWERIEKAYVIDSVRSECKAECVPSEDEVRWRGEGQPVVQEVVQAHEGPDHEAY